MERPLCVELYAGSFGWSRGWLEMGGRAVGFDLEHHPWHGPVPDGATLVMQDVRTLHGSQFKDASLILASPPCQFFSYTAMPFSRAKKLAAEVRADPSRLAEKLELFRACFRIQREASEAAGRHIPMVVENVKGAAPWVGKAKAHFGSFYLYGDLPALMPQPVSPRQKRNPDGTAHPPGSWFAVADSKNRGERAKKNSGGSWFNVACNKESGHGRNPVNGDTPRAKEQKGIKVPGLNFSDYGKPGYVAKAFNDTVVKQSGLSGPLWFDGGAANHSSRSHVRKAASAQIAVIPTALSRWIAQCYFPHDAREQLCAAGASTVGSL